MGDTSHRQIPIPHTKIKLKTALEDPKMNTATPLHRLGRVVSRSGLGYRDSSVRCPPLDYAKVKSCDGDDVAPHHYTASSGSLVHVGFKTFQCCHWSHSEKEELDDSKVYTRNSSVHQSSSPQSYSILLRKARSTPASPSRSRYRSHRYCSRPAAP